MDYLQTMLTEQLATSGWFLPIILVYLAGLLTSASPCVYPMIPITVGLFGMENTSSKKTSWYGPLVFVTGLSIVYGGLGIFAGLTGNFFGEISTHPAGYWLMANFAFIFSAWMFGWITIAYPSIDDSKLGAISSPFWRWLFMGAASGLVAAPCTAPVLGMLLMYVSTTNDPVFGGLLLLVFAYGLSTLLLVIGLSSRLLQKLPRSGVWMVRVKQTMALVMVASGEYFLMEGGKLMF